MEDDTLKSRARFNEVHRKTIGTLKAKDNLLRLAAELEDYLRRETGPSSKTAALRRSTGLTRYVE